MEREMPVPKLWSLCLGLLLTTLSLHSQIEKRLLFFGDAGVTNSRQKTLIADAATRILKGKTTVVFLGNNIFPDGMALSKGNRRRKDRQKLISQYRRFIQKGADVYFIPGNRDWDNNGPQGLKKIKAQGAFLKTTRGSLLHLIPAKGCPGPVVTKITDQVLMITLDTEWWLFRYEKTNESAGCQATTKKEVQTRLREILYNNEDKTILLVTHHPFKTNGAHGGKFSWKRHLFPLTAINPYFYLPLPGIGSLYPLFRKGASNPEDLNYPGYREMKRMISEVFEGFPNIVHIASHENGLQLLQDSTDAITTQIVTGIGRRKRTYLGGDKYTRFEAGIPGYVLLDVRGDGRLTFHFYGEKKGQVKQVYEYTQNYRPFTSWKSPVYKPIPGDSIALRLYPEYQKRGKVWRFFMGQNYRDIYAAPVKLPILRVSEFKGGLHPYKIGGGHQTRTLRMKDSAGKQYRLRSVLKVPDRVIPNRFRSPYLRTLVMDFYGSQHPFGALAVPPISHAVGVPHAHPVIGYTEPDPNLGKYYQLFAGKVNLLEEWEPLPPTDNYHKALKKLRHDNDNTFNGINFLKARMVDLLIGDWDRHKDQWRFHDTKKGPHKDYLIVPRDRDMAFNVTNGLLVGFAKYFLTVPHLYGFKSNLVGQVNHILGYSSFLNAEPAFQIDYATWMKTASQFKKKATDSVLREGVSRMPQGLKSKENRKILRILKDRRDQIPAAMNKYYHFINRIVDIHGTNRKEFVSIKGVPHKDALHIVMRKIDKNGVLRDTLMDKIYPKSITREIRIYLEKDKDSVWINNPNSTIKLRIIGGAPRHQSHKSYNIINSTRKIRVYDYKPEHYYGKTKKLRLHISKDSANTAFVPVNRYNTWMPLATAGFNRDAGFYFGIGAKYTRRTGFRKVPDVAVYKFMATHSLHTHAFEIKLNADWRAVLGKAHLIAEADIKAPKNTENFFGIGNETRYKKVGKYHSYYRTRFNLYKTKVALKWEGENTVFSLGPALQYYHYNPKENIFRYTNEVDDAFSPDSAAISKEKLHFGLAVNFTFDKRDNPLFPSNGFFVQLAGKAFLGGNTYAKTFSRFTAAFSFYKSLDWGKTLVFSDRIGGAITFGHPAFYQYAYIGGRGTLLGYRQYRFGGERSLYNNAALRWTFLDFGNKFFKGQLGLTGFFDTGRVWVNHDHSHKWHNGYGGGIFFAPDYSLVLHFEMGHSVEGWYPYFSFGLRF